ncbi:MAG TPA: DUF1614 domain-containing protein [Mariprofundaceae bacterium]|nr:DUF1614 domain-containing protein [Mariprofundaceae bacterium]
MRPNFSPQLFFGFIAILLLLIIIVQVGLVSIGFEKLGLSQQSAMLLLFSSLLGSIINLPLMSLKIKEPPEGSPPRPAFGLLRPVLLPPTGRVRIMVNVGGCLIPMTFSLYLFTHIDFETWRVILAIATMSAFAYAISRPLPGIGIGMPVLAAPIAAALTAIIIDSAHSAPLAYICGTSGVIIGADLLRISDIRNLGVPLASIGGAGTFDGIFITGIVAVLLA